MTAAVVMPIPNGGIHPILLYVQKLPEDSNPYLFTTFAFFPSLSLFPLFRHLQSLVSPNSTVNFSLRQHHFVSLKFEGEHLDFSEQ